MVGVALWLMAACAGPTGRDLPVRFLRGALLVDEDTPEALPVGNGLGLVAEPWKPGETVEFGGAQYTAPERAECIEVFHVPLGDVSRHIAMGGTPPDTAMAWSPDGSMLAIGSFLGELLVVDGWTGKVNVQARLAETMVKNLAWSEDGSILYAAEQSPDGTLRALDPSTLDTLWTRRLADHVGTSPLPDGDLYGVYTLPAAYGLEVLPGGDLLVAATHAWVENGIRRNQAQLLRISNTGETIATWPEEALDATLWHPRVAADGRHAVVPVGRSAAGPPPADVPIGGVILFALEDLEPRAAIEIEPLAPWFKSAFVWEAVDVDGSGVLLGMGDGRVQLRGLDGTIQQEITGGSPVLAGGIPITASVGSGFFHESGFVYQTSSTHIPFGAASPELHPPAPHPNGNALFAMDRNGVLQWTWRGPHVLEGSTLSPDGKTVAVGAGPRSSDVRTDLFGSLVFSLEGADPDGESHLAAFCATGSPVFFRQAIERDGRLAVAEHPYRHTDGLVDGQYRVTVLR